MVSEVEAMYAETRSETGLPAMSPAVRKAMGKVEQLGYRRGRGRAPGGRDRRAGPIDPGRRLSNGCIRLPNAVLRKVFRQALSGTPVVIRQ